MDIKCTDPNHPTRKNHANASVKSRWFDGVLATGSKDTGPYSMICRGCSLANRIDKVFPSVKSLEDRVADLEKKLP